MNYEYYYCTSHLYKKNCTSHACQKKIIEASVIEIINKYKIIIEEMDKEINDILNKKEISYDIEIIKNKINSNDEKQEKYIMLKDSIKDDLKEKLISEDEYWEYNNEYSNKIKKLRNEKEKLEDRLNKIEINSKDNTKWMEQFKKIDKIEKLDKLLIEDLIEDIVIDENKNLKVIFKFEDKYFEALDFINQHKCDIMSTSKTAS